MGSLKHEMRQLFEERRSLDHNERNSRFEDGLLEKIINLSFYNLYPYYTRPWKIVAIKSPVLLQKLYKIINDRKILDCAAALVIFGDSKDDENTRSAGFDLLSMSLMYASKYNCIDSYTIKEFNRESVIREFALDRERPAAAIICLGCFDGSTIESPLPGRHTFSDIVEEI